MITDRKIYYIDSSKRLSGNNSDFTYLIDMNNVNYQYAVVLQANIPKSYYLVENGYNTFILQEGNDISLIILPPGNYTRSSLKSILVQILNEKSPNNLSYKIESPKPLEADDGKYSFFVENYESVGIINFLFTDYLFEALGFNKHSTNTFIMGKLKSSNVIKLQIEDSIYIHSDLCTNGNDNVLQEIFTVNSSDFGNIIFKTPSFEAYSKKVLHNISNTFRFYITDEKDQPIELNGINCVFTILLYNIK